MTVPTRVNYWGGMHFKFSLEPAARMCTVANDFTRKGEALAQYLWTGDDGFLAPFGGYEAFGYQSDRTYLDTVFYAKRLMTYINY